MAKLEIRLKEEVKKRMKETSYVPRFIDYDVLIDGHEPSLLTEVKLDFDCESFPSASLTFFVDDLKVDGEFLAAVKAKIEGEKKDEN